MTIFVVIFKLLNLIEPIKLNWFLVQSALLGWLGN